MSIAAFAIRRFPLVLTKVLLALSTASASAGDLDAPADPYYPDGAMYTLQTLYDRLDTGATGAKRGYSFVGPISGPTTGTMVTLDAIMGKMPAFDETNAAAPENVLRGKTYWGLTASDSDWGPQTGTGTYAPVCTCQSPGSIYNAAGGGKRWCVNGNGTVTDLLGATVDGKTIGRCLVWLQNASWGGTREWRINAIDQYDDADTRAGLLANGATGANLSDGSVIGDWRLPTYYELRVLTSDPERILSDSPDPFLGVHRDEYYWSSSSYAATPSLAYIRDLFDGGGGLDVKRYAHYVWPVRDGQ